jgi:hypothetical protein
MMPPDIFKWVMGGAMGAAAFFFWQQEAQYRIDASQTASIASVEDDSRQYQKQMQESFRSLTASQANTAKILEGVASRIEAIDERGSRALITHERIRHNTGDD